jgi:GntR family transcriptional regulator
MKLSKSTPYYKQVKQEIYSRIQRGEWTEGDRIPSERVLCEQFQISRITVRQAISQAVNEGILKTYPGKGTFVIRKKASRGFFVNKDFSTMIRELGKEPRSRILESKTVTVNVVNYRLTEIFDASTFINLSILGSGNDEPLVYYSSYFPLDLGKKMIEKANQRVNGGLPFSTYDLYKDDVGVFPSKAHQTYESILANKTIAEILNIPETSAVFFIKSVFYMLENKPLEYREATYRGDRFIFHATREF